MTDLDLEDGELKRLAKALGRGAADGLDPERISEQVLARLRTVPRATVPRRVLRWAIGLAAAAGLAIAVVTRPGSHGSVPAASALVSLPELDDLSTAELEAVLESIPLPADSALHVEAAPIDELNAQELERVLRSLE